MDTERGREREGEIGREKEREGRGETEREEREREDTHTLTERGRDTYRSVVPNHFSTMPHFLSQICSCSPPVKGGGGSTLF